ncbi:glycosyltransferase [Rhodobacter sphaeroides]|uniref:glycosyltransferase family 4 protein n=1 Tax=Cereibacter sphaeroides TaxID=1063 RepID=UPI0013205D7C|nr:glycosyltransferase family 4 protein [Cereibacter sphaeroides]MWP39744.1 glycosyltransferase [Cereibacter sphaeroides]
MNGKHRILVIAHGHPDFHLGGGEIAAYNLFKAYREDPQVERAFFLARHDRGRGPTGAISLRRDDEYLWEQTVYDWFRMKAANIDCLHYGFAEFIEQLRPSVVHVHHYMHLGLEYLRIIKQVDPTIRVLMTLHEYGAICMNNGQMVKAGGTRLCSRESLDDCMRCFPEYSAEEFWLRKHRYRAYFDLVDKFVSPSEFLRQRYIAWGIVPERIVTIENGQERAKPRPPRLIADGEGRNRFGFFGQINPFKGIDVLLQALAMMSKSERRRLTLEMHGTNLEYQAPEFRERILELRAPLEKDGVLQWIGPYEPFQLADRMANVDWVLVPSVWWENSPMVIQEALSLGRPVVVSDIGGMAEKIVNGVNGVHVPVGNARAWADTLLRLCGETSSWEQLRAGILPSLSHADCARLHMQLLTEQDEYSGQMQKPIMKRA